VRQKVIFLRNVKRLFPLTFDWIHVEF